MAVSTRDVTLVNALVISEATGREKGREGESEKLHGKYIRTRGGPVPFKDRRFRSDLHSSSASVCVIN